MALSEHHATIRAVFGRLGPRVKKRRPMGAAEQLCKLVRRALSIPSLDLFPYRLEVLLHPAHSDREDLHEAQAFGGLGESGVKAPEAMLSS